MKRPRAILIIFLGVVLVTWPLCFWLAYRAACRSLSNNSLISVYGQFGDTFGVLNSLFTGLALAGAAYAFQQQYVLIGQQEELLKLQHKEMDRAKEDAAASEKARLQSESLMTRQAEALLAAARLGASSQLVHAHGTLADLQTRGVGDVQSLIGHAEDIKKQIQYTKIILNDLEFSPDLWGKALPHERTKVRKYYIKILREVWVRVVKDVPDIHLLVNESVRDYVVNELRLLLTQDGVIGSPDEEIILEGVNRFLSVSGPQESKDIALIIATLTNNAGGKPNP